MSGTVTPVSEKDGTPISAEEFADLMRDIGPLPDKIAVAVSGGPDSTALAYCLRRWFSGEVIGLLVEHGLRPESAQEAAQVKQTLDRQGIVTEILPWVHAGVKGRVHEKARTARYTLLTQACHRHGVADLFIAHHSGDQAETVLMRLAKGSGIDGLSGIAAQGLRDGVRLLRPFLSLTKARLIATCDAAGLAYVTDPSNAAEKYARGRLRRVMPLLEEEGLSVESLTALAERARDAKDALDYYTGLWLADHARAELGGCVRLDRAALLAAPRAIAMRALIAALRYVHDEDYPPEQGSLQTLLEILARPEAPAARTLYSCLISIADNHLTLLREPSAARQRTPFGPGQSVVWDQRWQVTALPEAALAAGVELRALGNPPRETLDALAPDLRRLVPQGRVRASLPALWLGEDLCGVPSLRDGADVKMTYCRKALTEDGAAKE